MAVKNYAELNINITDINSTTFVPALNGRQGDNNREVFLWLKNDLQGYDLTGKTVTLFVKDASGVVKTASTMNDQTGLSTGHFSLLIPSEVYQAPGAVQDSYIQIKQNDTIITSIPVSFNVVENTMLVTQTQSQTYLDSVQKLIDDTNERLSATTSNLTAVENAVQALKVTIANLNDQYSSDLFAKKANDNEFKGVNTFDQKIVAPNGLQGKADTAGLAGWANGAGQADTAKSVTADSDLQPKTIHAKEWSWFDGGIEIRNGITSHDWAHFNSLLTDSDATISGRIISKPQTRSIKFGQLTATMSRFGSSVFISIDTQPWPYTGATAWTVAYDMVIPVGYRPVSTASMTMINNYKMSSLKVNGNGAVFFTDTDVSNNTQFEAYGNWQTADDYPE
ncbi:hypothetical protein LMG30237_ALEAABJJ_01202 [Fructobacillus tropaeoli]|uniref:BppU family phage baseplate upper protein n=1 Tax=Fructobacillus tropaeoli TaxID=709323 RepID=UPI002D891474|nr:hypothetical protein LMG30237_ALEAABJJ_01202 [Fructobacillus tropaeoli]